MSSLARPYSLVSALCLASLSSVGCGGWDSATTYYYFSSDSYTYFDPSTRETATLHVDIDAGTFSLVPTTGDSISGTLVALDEDEWIDVSSGDDRSVFETFTLDPARIDLGSIQLTDGRLTEYGPTLFETGTDPTDGPGFELE